ncbi:sigma-70 family RNA polymerase sigma factor [Streptomyces sp. NPDC050564]|uniref:sigma-70 family RNA polymerase sigma factor n=1 Tax=Streptomyces sp. NPDC050564 TaxID=3365631 RepID=UPI0037A9C18F
MADSTGERLGGQSAQAGQATDSVLGWVARAQAGDHEAFGAVYAAYSDVVYRYVYHRIGGRATAEDLTSEVFARALTGLGSFSWQGRDMGAWLVTIARNLVADHFRSSRFRLEVTIGDPLEVNEAERSPEEHLLETLDHAALAQAVNRLPHRMRQVTWMRAQGICTPAIAQRLHITPATVRVHLHQARQRLAADQHLRRVLFP